MFSVYGLQGRIFNGTVDQWRRVAQVSALDRSAALRPGGPQARQPATAPDGSTVAAAAATTAAEPRREAIAAYTDTQHGGGQRHPLSQVHGLMSASVVTLSQDLPLAKAWPLLAEQGIGQAPAVDDQGRLVGFISRSDILRAVVAEPPLELWA